MIEITPELLQTVTNLIGKMPCEQGSYVWMQLVTLVETHNERIRNPKRNPELPEKQEN